MAVSWTSRTGPSGIGSTGFGFPPLSRRMSRSLQPQTQQRRRGRQDEYDFGTVPTTTATTQESALVQVQTNH
jgi:hypothetical protein